MVQMANFMLYIFYNWKQKLPLKNFFAAKASEA